MRPARVRLIGWGISGGCVVFETGMIVVATDTGVGKTFVAAGLLCALRKGGRDALPMKPVQTGATPDGRAPDLDFCLAAAELNIDPTLYDRLSPYRFPLPASPHLAARVAGETIDFSRVSAAFQSLRGDGRRAVVIEAAGGLLVPLTESLLQVDALMRFELPFILVARAGLGTLNHTLLSVEALRARGAKIARIYLNATTADIGIIEDDNAHFLARALPDIPVRRIPFQADPSPRTAAAMFSASDV